MSDYDDDYDIRPTIQAAIDFLKKRKLNAFSKNDETDINFYLNIISSNIQNYLYIAELEINNLNNADDKVIFCNNLRYIFNSKIFSNSCMEDTSERNLIECNRFSINSKNIIKKYLDINKLDDEINSGNYDITVFQNNDNFRKKDIFLRVILGNIVYNWTNHLPNEEMMNDLRKLTDGKAKFIVESNFNDNFYSLFRYFNGTKDFKLLYKFYLEKTWYQS